MRQGLAVVGSGSTIVLVAGSDLVSYTSSLCLDSYDGLALQQEQFKVIAASPGLHLGPDLYALSSASAFLSF